MRSYFDRNSTIVLLLLVFTIAPSPSLWAWTEHPLVIHETLVALPDVRDAQPVKVEGLDSFLTAEEKGLVGLLESEETWARANLMWYRPLPEGLEFRVTGNAEDIRLRFCHAVRINPQTRFGLYLQFVPGADTGGRPGITPDRLTFLKDLSEWKSTTFAELKAGETVSPLDIVTTASDEPDFGLDIGLYEDNGTDFGRIYGFGMQPFGNPNLEYSSQGPFHMGYYHEAWIINTFGGFVKKTYPEHRIHLYKSLSEYAFRTGHDYWGWRFMGIGLHYVMDLTLPYHTTLLPGVSTIRMLWINILDMIGISGPMAEAIQLVSNRHTAIEKFQQMAMQEAYRAKNHDYTVFVALRSVEACPEWDDRTPRYEISAKSNALSGKADKVMEETMPQRWVSDPSFELGTSPEQDDILAMMKQKDGNEGIDINTDLLREMLEPLPGYTCSYVRSILVK
ncbi:MAG: hypothetical protein MUD15_07885 [Desulfobacterota bacterium]|nr:hypothetical protein [Thermodesulfobacteriota bacterium]